MTFEFHHVAISVADIRASSEFYAGFGFRQVASWVAEDESLRIVHLKLGEALLELFCYREPMPLAEDSKFLDRDLRILGCKHFGLRVASIADAVENIRRAGYKPLAEVRVGRTGIQYCFYQDPDGIFVELVQDDRKL